MARSFSQEMQFERLLAERIAAHTGVKPKVTLESSVGEAEQRQMKKSWSAKLLLLSSNSSGSTAPSIKVEGLDLTDKPVTIFHGKMFSPKNLTPLKDLGGEGGKCMIWGDVFFTEVKGSFRKIYYRLHHRLHRLHQPEDPCAGRGGLLQVGVHPQGHDGRGAGRLLLRQVRA